MTQYAYSTDQENYSGLFDTVAEAQGEATASMDMSGDYEPGDEYAYWIGEVQPAEALLQASRIGQDFIERLDEWLADDIPADCGPIAELSNGDQAELGRLVIEFVRAKGGFKRYGITNAVEHKHVISETDP